MARGERTASGLRVLPPRANFQELVILPRGFVPRQLWIRHGLGIDAELVVMLPTRYGARMVPTWRAFDDDEGHVMVGIGLARSPRALLIIWSSHSSGVSVIDWKLSQEPLPRPVFPVLDTSTGDPLTGFEVAIAHAFDVPAGVVRLVADEAAARLRVGRRELVEWIDRRPWVEVERSYWMIRAEAARAPLPRTTSVARAALSLWFTSAARAMQNRS